MNKTVTVNIGGIVFHIDENAYERFKQYLESIRIHFTTSDGRDEIMQDIESRIAEMFQERIKDQKQVITLADVEEITAIMGKPEDFGDEKENQNEAPASEPKVKRRLFRNPDDNLVGGVCSGIAAYFDIDAVWVRLAFAISMFVFGSGFLLYLILWIVIPKAQTTADKLQMKGEPINVSNIEKNVQEELEHVKKRLDEIGKGKRPGNIITQIFEAIGQIFKFIFLFIGKLIAIFFIFIGLVIVFAMFASVLAFLNVPGTHYPEVLNQIFPPGIQLGLAFVSAMFVVGIPFLMLAYFGARVLFNIKKSSRIVNLSALGLWLAALCSCAFIGFSIAGEFSEKQSVRKQIDILQPSSNTFVLKTKQNHNEEKDYDNWGNDDWDGDLRLTFNEHELQSKNINLDVVESNTDSFELVQICYARGDSKKSAAEHATRITYSFTQQDSVLTFDPYFTINKDEKFRSQKIQLILKVPVGKKVYLDKTLQRFIYDIKNVGNIYDNDMLKHRWIMKEDGLNCMDCDGTESTIDESDFEIDGSNGTKIHIDDNGVRINGDNKKEVIIGNSGVHISGDNDKQVRIDSNGVYIHTNGK